MADIRRARETIVGPMHHKEQQQKQQHRRGYSMSNARREKDEDLALFQDMRKRERTQYLLSNIEDAKLGDLFDPVAAACIERKGVGADLLNSDADKNEYDWLLTPPGTPLFPSIDLESLAYTPLQQQGLLLMNHSLAAIKTSRIAGHNQAEGPVLKLACGNPNPNQKPSNTPMSSQSNSTPRSTPTTSGTPPSVKPSTPTKFSFRASTRTQQSPSVTSSFSTGKASTAHSNRPSTPTNRPSTPTGRPSTPTLRRSSSSSTSSRAFSTGTVRGNPSPTRSTASSGPSRGISPVRSQYKGASSPARGRSPVSVKERGSSPSPRKHPVIIPDGLPSDIPPNLRTTSDRGPSSAHHRHAGYFEGTTAQMPDVLDHSANQPSSPNFIRSRSSISRGQDRLNVHSGRVSSDDDSSSYEVSSQSAVSSRGLTPERGRGYAQQQQPSVGTEDWRNSHSSFQAKQSPSPRDPPHFGTALTRKTPNAALRSSEIQRPSSAGAFRPLMTKNSISTLYSISNSATARANTLPCRPHTPGSTASSEPGAASVVPDSEGDEDLLNDWGQLELSSLGGGHTDILVLDKEHENLTIWESLQQHEKDPKLPKSTTLHSDIHDEADSYKSHGLSREALVGEEKESSLYSMSSSTIRESKTRSIHDEESNSESKVATRDWLCLDPVAMKGTNLNVREEGREQLEPKQQISNSQAEEDVAALPEFWCNSELNSCNELDTERGRRTLPFSSSLLNDEPCGSENEVAIGKEREISPHPEIGTGIAVDLMHVREKLMLLCHNPNLELPGLEQCKKQDEKLEQPKSGSIVVEQRSIPSLVVLPVHELCVSSEHGSNNNSATEEVEKGSNIEAATEVTCVCNHARHPGKHCDNPGCDCSSTGHTASADAKIELQSVTHDKSVESEAVKGAISSPEAQNVLHMGRQKNIWYMYKNSEDYVSSLCDNTETEFNALSSWGGGGFTPKVEREIQTVGSHHRSTFSSSGMVQVLEELGNQQGIDDEASNHEGQQSEDSLNPFTIGSEEIPDGIQSKLESHQKEKEGSQYGVVEQKDNSMETAFDSHTNCVELQQLLNYECEHASGVWQELKPGSVVLGRSADDSEAYILSSVLSDQELDPNLESTWGENPKMKDRTGQEVMAETATDDVLKQDDGETSTSSEELDDEGKGPGDGLLEPLIAEAPNQETVESRVASEETKESEVQTAVSSPGDHQDLEQSGRDPQAVVASTPQIACPDFEALAASTPQIAGPDPEALVASTLQTAGLDSQELVACAQVADPDTQAVVDTTPQIVHANQVADVIRAGEEDAEHDQANVHSDQKGLELTRENEAALETREADACSQRDEVRNVEKGMTIACLEFDFVDILEDGGGCTSLSHPSFSDAASVQSSVSGTKDHVDVNMPAEEHPKQVQCSDTSDLVRLPPMMHSPVESEEMIIAGHALKVVEAATQRVSEFDEVIKELKHTEGQGTKPVVSVSFVVNDNKDMLTPVKPVVKLHKNPIRDDYIEKLIVDIDDIVCTKGFDDGSKEVTSCDAQKQGAEEGSQQSPCVEKKLNTLHLTSLYATAFETPYSELRGNATARMQATLSKSESLKSSGSFLASSLDVSQSTDTISSCPSNSSWEDPQYSLSSGFWEMMKSSPTNAQVPDDVLGLPFPIKLQKQGTGIKQEDDVTKSSQSFGHSALMRFGTMSASQPQDESIIKEEMPSEENCLDYYTIDDALLGGLETSSAAGLQQMVENLKALSDPETKKKEEISTETNCEAINARTSNQMLASEETAVEGTVLVPPKDVESMNALDSVEAHDGEMVILPNVVQSPFKDEIVENSESPGPNAREHLSSFKFGRKKTSTMAEPERKDLFNTHLEVLNDDDLKKEAPLPGKLLGKSQTMPGAKAVDALNGMQLSKVNMVVRDGKSSMQEVQSGDSAQSVQLTQWSTNGIRQMAEELNSQSRLPITTVPPGSVSEHFEWGHSSLDKVSCSSGSGSKPTDKAAGVISNNITLAEVTDRILFCSSIVHDLVYEAAELASKKEKASCRITASSSPDLEASLPNALSPSHQETYHEHDNNQNGHMQEESTNVGNAKYHEFNDNQNGHAREESNKVINGTTIAARRAITYLPNDGIETLPGMRKPMSSPQAQVMCIAGEDAESKEKEDVIMHPTEAVRLNHKVNSIAKSTNEKCRCVIL